jgi:hypothetical protein
MSLLVTPNPTTTGATVTVIGADLTGRTMYRVLLDGVVKDNVRTTKGGGFAFGVYVGTVAKTAILTLEKKDKGSWVLVHSVPLVIKEVVEPPPPPPPPPPPTGLSRTVTSVAELMSVLLDDAYGEIILRNGTYRVTGAGHQASNSLYIGSKYAPRTRPILVRAETPGGVLFDGGGMTYFGGIVFKGGAHHQEWYGFRFGNGEATETGVVVFGGPNEEGLDAGPHHITLHDITFDPTCHGYAYDPARSNVNDHGVYFSDAIGGSHDIVIDGMRYVANPGETKPLQTLLHWYDHGFATPSIVGYNFTCRNLRSVGQNNGIMLWAPELRNVLLEDVLIENARLIGVRYEKDATALLRRVTTVGTKQAGMGFYSSKGTYPNVPGITFESCSFQ